MTCERVHSNIVAVLQKVALMEINLFLKIFQRFLKKPIEELFSGFTLMIHLLSFVCFKLFSVACFVQNITFIIFEETQAQVQF